MRVISDKAECCGCTACSSICPRNCIEMLPDEEGFLYPSIQSGDCIGCHACEQVCPFPEGNAAQESRASVYAAVQYADEAKRFTSTAGGAFSLIADHLLRDGAVVYAAGYDGDAVVCHQRVETGDGVAGLRGSKYVQSRLGDVFRRVKTDLQDENTVLFTGTPCQIHGLKKYVGDNEHLYTIDLLCLGVSSPALFREYVNYLSGKYGERVARIQFRDKHYGYAAPNIRICFHSGRFIEQQYDSKVHADLFFRSYYDARPSCYSCKFRGIARVSDFTIGDFTEIGSVSREMDDDKGTTKLWAHSPKGQALLRELSLPHKMTVLEESASNIVGGPERQIPQPERRAEFFRDAGTMEYAALIRKWAPKSLRGELVGLAKRGINRLPFRSFIFKIIRARSRKRYHNRVRDLNW